MIKIIERLVPKIGPFRRGGTMTVEMKIIRADGTVEDLGVVSKSKTKPWKTEKGK